MLFKCARNFVHDHELTSPIMWGHGKLAISLLDDLGIEIQSVDICILGQSCTNCARVCSEGEESALKVADTA